MKCPSCGMESIPGANVCGHCGYRFSAGNMNGQPSNSQPQYQQQNQPNQAQYQQPQTPYRPPKKGMSTGAKVGIIAAVLVVGALLAYAVILPAVNGNSNANLSPSRDLPGTWKTTVPTKFSFSTDFAADAGYQMWNVTFTITKTGDPNVVNVQMYFQVASSAIVQGSLAIPEVSPMYLTGAINSSQMQLRSGTNVVGVFSFTTSTMTGTFDQSSIGAFSQQVHTDTNAIKLYKQ
jgi:hypothetical protein